MIQDIYNRDEYVLKDGDKTARVRPTRGVKQGCPLSPLLLPLYITILMTLLAEGVSGAITGTAGVHVSHMLYSKNVDINRCNSIYWFRSAVKLFNSMLNTNSNTLRRVVQAHRNLQPRSSACWTAQLLSAF